MLQLLKHSCLDNYSSDEVRSYLFCIYWSTILPRICLWIYGVAIAERWMGTIEICVFGASGIGNMSMHY